MNRLRRRLRILFRREQFHNDLEEEMQSHVEMQAEENAKRRNGPDRGRYAAALRNTLAEESAATPGPRCSKLCPGTPPRAAHAEGVGITATAIFLPCGIGAHTDLSAHQSVLSRAVPCPRNRKELPSTTGATWPPSSSPKPGLTSQSATTTTRSWHALRLSSSCPAPIRSGDAAREAPRQLSAATISSARKSAGAAGGLRLLR